MKRTQFDERRDHQIAAEFSSSQMECSFCRLLADKTDLAAYGARCLSCYQAYCGRGRHYPVLTPERRREMGQHLRQALSCGMRAGPRQHLANLRQRAASGAPMTAGQRGFLEAARGAFVDDVPAAPAPMSEVVVRAHLPAAETAPAPRAETMDEPPAWATET